MTPADILRALEPGAIDAWISEQRWFAAKARGLARVEIVDAVELGDQEPIVVIAIIEAVFHAGTREHYQLPLVLHPVGAVAEADRIAVYGDTALADAVRDPDAGLTLGRLVTQGGPHDTTDATRRVTFHHAHETALPPVEEIHPLTAEQSNSSIVYDGTVIMKCYRRIPAGESPELEMLRFLSRTGFPHVPELLGWYDYRGEALATTLGVAQRFIPDGRDGWQLTLDRLAADPDGHLADLASLGRTVAELHTVLGSDPEDPDFAPGEKTGEMLDLAVASIADDIRDVFSAIPEDDERFAPIAGRGADLAALVRHHQHLASVGATIRLHGDLHLGQGLLTDDGTWMILDFEGEPARALRDRRRKRSPLRDVAALLRSVAYAVATARQDGVDVPDAWEAAARAAIMDAYYDHVDRALLPPGEQADHTLLRIFELEKAV
ncbi:MAG: maltokinase N-terminal cap-like domain-containing protein, partial [Solirubrobacteraceae bacterium]